MQTITEALKNFLYASLPFLKSLCVAAIIFGLALLVHRRVVRLCFALLRRLLSRVKTELPELILSSLERPAELFLVFFGAYIASCSLVLSGERLSASFDAFALRSFRISIICLITWAASRFITPELLSIELLSKGGGARGKTFCLFFARILKLVVVAFGVVIIINELGYNVGGLIAGLGLGGLTFALAAQDSASNMFGGAVILFDKPFEVDDWISTDASLEGVVEDITFRTTRIRTFDNAQIIVPNSLLVSKPITNWSRMEKRKISFDVGLCYASDPERLRELTERVEALLSEDEDVDKGLISVSLNEFADSAVKVRVHFFTRLTDYKSYMKVKERVNYAVGGIVRELGLSFAFPTRTVHLGDIPRP